MEVDSSITLCIQSFGDEIQIDMNEWFQVQSVVSVFVVSRFVGNHNSRIVGDTIITYAWQSVGEVRRTTWECTQEICKQIRCTVDTAVTVLLTSRNIETETDSLTNLGIDIRNKLILFVVLFTTFIYSILPHILSRSVERQVIATTTYRQTMFGLACPFLSSFAPPVGIRI